MYSSCDINRFDKFGFKTVLICRSRDGTWRHVKFPAIFSGEAKFVCGSRESNFPAKRGGIKKQKNTRWTEELALYIYIYIYFFKGVGVALESILCFKTTGDSMLQRLRWCGTRNTVMICLQSLLFGKSERRSSRRQDGCDGFSAEACISRISRKRSRPCSSCRLLEQYRLSTALSL